MAFSHVSRLSVLDLGHCSYSEGERQQLAAVERRVRGGREDYLILAEFDPVLTVGRGARADTYHSLGLPVHEVPRGGKVTYHGPGQLVAYPIIGLEGTARDLHAYLYALEEALISTVGDYGLAGGRDPRNTGCWVRGRKIASIGVAVRRWVAYHGVALNISTDMEWFRRFDPCGLDSDSMTSMALELASPPSFEDVKRTLADRLRGVLRG